MGKSNWLNISQENDLNLQLTAVALRQLLFFSFSKGSCCFSIFWSPWHCFRPCVRGTLDRITMTEAKCWSAGIENCLFTHDPEQNHGCYIVQGGLEENQCCCRRGLPEAQVISPLLFSSFLLAFMEFIQICCLGVFLPGGPCFNKILDSEIEEFSYMHTVNATLWGEKHFLNEYRFVFLVTCKVKQAHGFCPASCR